MARKRKSRSRRVHQEPIVRRIAAILDGGNPTRFRYEGAAVAGLRAHLCLAGSSWQVANQTAVLIVELALHRIGASRPTWQQGQPEWHERAERWFCEACGGPIESETRWRYCSDECRAIGAGRMQTRRMQEDIDAARAAFRAANGDVPDRNCLHCGESFRVIRHHPLQKFCSRACLDAAIRVDRARVCAQCGATYQRRHRGQRFCSNACHDAARSIRRAGTCRSCGSEFTIAGRRERWFCSKGCATRARHAARRAGVEWQPLRCEAA